MSDAIFIESRFKDPSELRRVTVFNLMLYVPEVVVRDALVESSWENQQRSSDGGKLLLELTLNTAFLSQISFSFSFAHLVQFIKRSPYP